MFSFRLALSLRIDFHAHLVAHSFCLFLIANGFIRTQHQGIVQIRCDDWRILIDLDTLNFAQLLVVQGVVIETKVLEVAQFRIVCYSSDFFP